MSPGTAVNINAQLGETMTMKDCWMAAYIKSANEVCAQIAETVGGTEANFVEMMNQKAKELGCTHTHFANASVGCRMKIIIPVLMTWQRSCVHAFEINVSVR